MVTLWLGHFIVFGPIYWNLKPQHKSHLTIPICRIECGSTITPINNRKTNYVTPKLIYPTMHPPMTKRIIYTQPKGISPWTNH